MECRILMFVFALFLFTNAVNSQDLIFEKELEFVTTDTKYKRVFPFYNHNTGETVIFTEGEETQYLDLHTIDLEQKESTLIRGNKPTLPFSNIVGAAYTKETYYAYYLNKAKNTVGAVSYNLETFETHTNRTNLEFEVGEKVITQFSYNNSFYFVTIEKETSNLYFHIFNGEQFIDKVKMVFNDDDFPHFLKNNLYNSLAFNDGKYKPIDLLNPLYLGLERDYFFVQEGSLNIVMNTNKILKIRLDDLSYTLIDIPINYEESNDSYQKSLLKNVIKQTRAKSTILDQYFFRVNILNNEILIQVYDLETEKELLNTAITINNLDYKVVYDSEHSRDLDMPMKNNVMFKALQTGEYGLRVVKEGADYKIHIGKVATKGFWDIFDDKTIPSKRNKRFNFDSKFVGVFADYNGRELKNNLITPFFVRKKIQSRYFDIRFNVEKGINSYSNERFKGITNKYVDLTDFIRLENYKRKHGLNGFFRMDEALRFVELNPTTNLLRIYAF